MKVERKLLPPPKNLSIVIPAHNEAGIIGPTVRNLHKELEGAGIEHEILVVNDHSKDETENILKILSEEISEVRYINNQGPGGFGFAVRCGLENFKGESVAVVMADESDPPEDVVRFFRVLEEGYECAFGSRFIRGAKCIDYPWLKLFLNRCANSFIQVLFGLKYNDVTNAFKMYRREVVQGLRPFLSHHFNLTVELPLKAIVRGYNYKVIPNTWINRKEGVSKFNIREMGSRYMFIIIYCFIEKWLSAGDYFRKA